MAALTQEIVDSAPARNTWLSDGDCRGLMLRTSSNGRKAWYWNRKIDGKPKRVCIGETDRLTLLEARAHVRRGDTPQSVTALQSEIAVLHERLDGKDAELSRLNRDNVRLVGQLNAMVRTLRRLGLQPMQNKVRVRNGKHEIVATAPIEGRDVLFETLAREWFDIRTPEWSKASRAAYASRMKTVLTHFGSDRIAKDISPTEIAELLNSATATSTRNALGVILRGAFGVAVAKGTMENNPAEQARTLIRKNGNAITHRAAIAVEDAPAFFQSLGDSKAEQALKLVMLTAVRVGAVEGGSVDEVDTETATWVVPESRQSKTKRTPRVPMVPAALACLDGLGTRAEAIRKVIAEMPFEVHGMRTCFRMWCQREGVQFELGELAIGHVIGNQTTRAYARDDLLTERRAVMQAWADYLTTTA